ncbi:beta-galactosidase [Limimaricola soesokkakensis]|uniref:Beta-galactosidase n=1 Tax=Limimaricola soesokkakensis TaxID=1343159 RepID=A0A1X6ZN14_9RHOB|nr:beta-galactosidase [Limimaricola soesokkakensis]PSK85832.1 beta-galactosidase [Limimaricola soesokkakensis]SLN56514.1 Beta-galactosidase [Limimaricola soesokkakensis]
MTDLIRTLGCCYYPEQWPRTIWAEDARRMAETGLTWVRIGEFAWAKLEPRPGELRWDWLDEAIWTLGEAGLKVVLGTPTATPPRWVLDKHPDMLAVDAQGRPRKFGSRRHYCFSHEGYATESDRIVGLMADRYGRNDHVAAWQTDNEYGCHDTTISYSDAARAAFRRWLRDRYGDIEALNTAWGNVFWSMEYRDFDEIDLPNLTVTEPNPAHALAFRRFSSDQVVAFNRRQVEIIRARSSAPITHNYMGRITDFDHFAVGADLDFASWDSYPLGFLEDRAGAAPEQQRDYARQGDPDFQALHHDLYRAVGRGRWWVMEQQPGPVNWAPHNPAPLPGMVRLWSWEAFAHGAECVSYFRWRQAPFAQEQLHAGLLRPDSQPAPGLEEAAQVAREIAQAPAVANALAEVAILFDYDADAAWAVQPHGQGLSYFGLVLDLYKAMRGLGLSIDILPATTRDFTGYRLIAAPGLMHMPDALKSALAATDAEVLIGPRAAARDAEFSIPVPLPPAFPGLDVTVTHVESLRTDRPEPLDQGGAFTGYREALEGTAKIVERTASGAPALMREGRVSYLGGWPDPIAARRIIAGLCTRAGLDTVELPEGIRRRDTGTERFWFNHTERAVQVEGLDLPPISVTRRPR